MGLAERFKNKLENKNIFQKSNIEKSLENNDIRFISKPVTVQPKEIHTAGIINPVEAEPEIHLSTGSEKFGDLETEVIDKIRKTPYWEEYTIARQEKMISLYFDKKIQTPKYKDIQYCENTKKEFIRDILALANNR